MTMDEYIKWLENRIATVGTELEILINARKAIEMARGELDNKKAPLDQPKAKRLTLAQTVAKKEIEKSGDNWQQTLAKTTDLIRVAPDITSGEVITRYYLDRDYQTLTKREKDRVYAALSYLKTQKMVTRSPQGTWSISATLMPEASDG
jgi:hypothetical protein